ncbi:hypothetical protein C8Q80DRAFT_1205150 [Daedaleopsis nitida]|nr:hypothetical protein C8Q80DRAFT_1205150 [Daedaleopsis nitida]
MTVLVLCNICQDHHTIADIRALPCGHTNCADCIHRYLEVTPSTRSKYPCPHCRKTFKRSEPHPIFLEYADSASQATSGENARICHPDAFHRQVYSALKDLGALESEQRKQTVERAVEGVEKVSKMMDGRDCLLRLLTAVAARWRGMLPILTTIASQREEIVSLHGKVKMSKEAAIKAEKLAHEAVKASERTLPTLQKTRSELREAQIKIEQLEHKVKMQTEEHKTEIAQKTEDTRRLHDMLRELKEQEKKQRVKIKELREDIKERSRQLEYPSSNAQPLRSVLNEAPPDELIVLPESGSVHHVEGDRYASRLGLSPSTSSPRKRKRSEGDDSPLFEAENAASGNLLRPQPQASSSRAAIRPETKRPVFSSDWTLPGRPAKPGSSLKLQEPKRASVPSVIKVDEKGRPLVPVQCGSRRREKF